MDFTFLVDTSQVTASPICTLAGVTEVVQLMVSIIKFFGFHTSFNAQVVKSIQVM